MKTKSHLITFATRAAVSLLQADKVAGGPKGGRLL
jgi:hypothetical protein